MKYTNKIRRISFIIIICVVSFLLLGLIACNKSEYRSLEDKIFDEELRKFSLLLKDGKPAFSLKQARGLAEKIIPMVETAAGKKFKQKPKIGLMTTSEIEQFIIDEATSSKILNNSNYPIHFIKKNISINSKLILGIYDYHDQMIYLLPQRFLSRLNLYNLDKKFSLDIAKMVIAHELTHALQDQHINFVDRYNEIPGFDERYAFNAAIEGHAMFIERKIEKQLNIDNRIINLPPLSDLAKMQFDDPKINQILNSFYAPYVDGENFIRHHYEKGGNGRIWEIFESPPVDSAMIIYPEIYFTKNYDSFNYKNILNNIYDFNKGYENYKFIYINTSFSKLDFRIFLKDFTPTQKKYLLSNINHVQILNIHHKNNLLAEIKFFLLKSESSAGKILGLLEKMEDNVFKTGDTSEIQKWTDMYLAGMFKNSIDSARQTSVSYNFKTDNNGIVQNKSNHFILRKNNMVVIFSDDILHSRHKVKNIASIIFTRYQKAIKQKNIR